MNGFKTKHTQEERDEWIETLHDELVTLLQQRKDNTAIALFNERSHLGLIDSIYAVHNFRDQLIEQGKLPRKN